MRHLPFVAFSVITLACASGAVSASHAQADSAAPAKSESKPKSDPNHLSADEITASNRPTTYDVVDHERRAWLRKDALTGEDVVIYMDEQNIGGSDKLRDLPSVEVAELQYLPHADAVKRWGSQIKGAVIVVTRKR